MEGIEMKPQSIPLLLLTAVFMSLLVACGGGIQPSSTAFPAAVPTPKPASTPTPVKLPEVTFTPVPTTKAGEAEIAARMRLSATLGITAQAFTVYSTESLDWSNASLGCPKTGYSYAQVITPGYKITFDVDGVHYKVHTNLDGSSTVLCNESATPTPVPSTLITAAEGIEAGGTCTLSGGEVVQQGWSGKDTGSNDCNQCRCLNAGLACTKMACPSVKLLATSTPVPPTATPWE